MRLKQGAITQVVLAAILLSTLITGPFVVISSTTRSVFLLITLRFVFFELALPSLPLLAWSIVIDDYWLLRPQVVRGQLLIVVQTYVISRVYAGSRLRFY